MQLDISFDLNTRVFDSLNGEFNRLARSLGRTLGRRAQELQEREAPVDTGELRALIERRKQILPDGIQEDIGSTAKYAAFVVRGTGLFRVGPGPKERIRPKRARALFFDNQFFASVAGQRPNDYVTRAFETLETEIDQIIDSKLVEFFR